MPAGGHQWDGPAHVSSLHCLPSSTRNRNVSPLQDPEGAGQNRKQQIPEEEEEETWRRGGGEEEVQGKKWRGVAEKEDGTCVLGSASSLVTHSVRDGVGVGVGDPGHLPLAGAHVRGGNIDTGS